ncbi:MAG: hypothetical protein QOD00_3598, partial [Blastocatellia bacterium]|nr:hypothetical protein [Blastocatellia bacterium]
MSILIDEVAALYQAFIKGEQSPLPELEVQYADFAQWQREWLQGEVLERELAYWREQLAGMPVLEMPTDRSRPPVPSYRGARESFVLPPEVSQSLKQLSRQEGTTLFMLLLSAFDVLLYHYTGQEDILLGTNVANRNRAETEKLIGFFINQLVIRTDLSGNPRFKELMSRTRDVTLEAYAHQDLPFEKLVGALQLERDLSRAPVYQVKFELNEEVTGNLSLPGLTINQVGDSSKVVRYDLHLTMNTLNGLSGHLAYATELFDQATVNRMTEQFKTILSVVAGQPDVPLDKLLSALRESDEQRRLEREIELKQARLLKYQSVKRKAFGKAQQDD